MGSPVISIEGDGKQRRDGQPASVAGHLSYAKLRRVVIDFTIEYNKADAMTLGIETRGRPFYVADIPSANDTRLRIMTEFYQVTARLKYRDIRALARCLGRHPSTIDKWKYRVSFPSADIAMDVIEWVRRGKPVTKVYQRDKRRVML